MKKFSSILVLIAVLATGFVFVGCGDGALEHNMLADTPGLTTGILAGNKAKFSASTGIIDFSDTSGSGLFSVKLPSAINVADGKSVKVTILAVPKASDATVDLILKKGSDGTTDEWGDITSGDKYVSLTSNAETTLTIATSRYANGDLAVGFQRKDDSKAFKLKIVSIVIQ